MNNTYLLDHKLSLSEIASRIAAGEQIVLKEATSTVTRICPNCQLPVTHAFHNTHWYDAQSDQRFTDAGLYIANDGDSIFLQEAHDSFKNKTYEYLDLECFMEYGYCTCGQAYGFVGVYCFDHIPRPEEGAKGDIENCVLFQCDYEHMARSVEESKLFVIYVGQTSIGVMHYGKNVLFHADNFHGYPTEDFTSDCCVFELDCLLLESKLDDSPIGVTCGHFDMNDTKNDWSNAATVTRALYAAGKAYMSQQSRT